VQRRAVISIGNCRERSLSRSIKPIVAGSPGSRPLVSTADTEQRSRVDRFLGYLLIDARNRWPEDRDTAILLFEHLTAVDMAITLVFTWATTELRIRRSSRWTR